MTKMLKQMTKKIIFWKRKINSDDQNSLFSKTSNDQKQKSVDHKKNMQITQLLVITLTAVYLEKSSIKFSKNFMPVKSEYSTVSFKILKSRHGPVLK